MKKTGVAIIGSGYWGANYVRTFNDIPEVDPLVVCDSREERLQEIGARFPRVTLSTNLDDALRHEGVEAVVVCTPATTHYEVVLACLAAGKHVLVEKPITTKSHHAERLIEVASNRKLVLMVGHTFIHNPGVKKIKSYMEAGDLGRPYYLYARWTNMGPLRHDVNALWDLAPHDISVFNYLLDSVPEWASAVGSRVLGNGREDVGFISLGYPGNVIGHIHVSWADPHKVRELVVVGSDRRIVFDDLNSVERVRVFEKGIRPVSEPASYGEHQLEMRDGDIISPKIESSEPLKNQCLHFLECASQGQVPITTGLAGLQVVQTMEAIDRSVALNGAPVFLEPQAIPEAIAVGDGRVLSIGLDRRFLDDFRRSREAPGHPSPRHNGHNGHNGNEHTNGHTPAGGSR